MANQPNPTLESVDYPQLDRGMNTTRPNRSMSPGSDGPLFKLVENMTGHDGLLGSYGGVFPLSEFETNGYPSIDRNGSYFETAPDGLLNGQCVMWQFWDYPQTWNNSTATTAQSSFGSFMGVVVTSREIHVYSPQDHNWYNATPVYATPAITVSVNGATGVVTTTAAADAKWSAYKIVPGQLIEFSANGNWWTIESVDSDTQLTTNYAGANIGPVAYTIRRCFGGRNYSHGDNLLYGTVFNGDLYIAGRTLAGAGNGPAVIRVNAIYDTAQVTEYLLAGFDLTGAMTAAGSVIADLWDIKGIQVLPDGRVVIGTAEVPGTKLGIMGNRIRYSSNVGNTLGTVSAQEQWVASPAGFIDIVDHSGELIALGRLGPSTLTLHFHRGISLGTYTAAYDPPLAIQASRAKVGCFAPRTLSLYRGQEIFLGADGLVHAFNGEETAEVSDETVEMRHNGHGGRNDQSAFAMANTHAVVDTRKDQYRLFFCDNNFEQTPLVPASYSEYTINTVCWVIDLQNEGQFYKETYAPHVTSAAMPAIGPEAATSTPYVPASVGGNFGLIILGTNSAPPSATAEDILGDYILYGLHGIQDNLAGNHVWHDGAYATGGSHQFETDWIDFGLPGTDKTLCHVLIWFQTTSTAILTIPTVVATALDANTYTAVGPTTFQVLEDTPVLFSFEPVVSEAFKISVSKPLSNHSATSGGLAVRRMRVYYQSQGEIEASGGNK